MTDSRPSYQSLRAKPTNSTTREQIRSVPRCGARVAAAATRPRYRWILQVATTPSNISLSEPDDNSAAALRRRGRTRSAPPPISWSWRVMAVPRARRAPGRAVPWRASGGSRALRTSTALCMRSGRRERKRAVCAPRYRKEPPRLEAEAERVSS